MENQSTYTFLRNNSGAIILTLAIILYQIYKTYYKIVKKKLYNKFYKYTSPLHTYIDLSKAPAQPDSQYLRVRHIGGTSLVIKSPSLASKIIIDLENFQDGSFPSRTINLARDLLHLPVESKTLKKLLNTLTQNNLTQNITVSPQEGNADVKTQKKSTEYRIHSNESLSKTNVIFTSLSNDQKTYLPKLYPSLATKERSDTEKTRSPAPFSANQPVKFTSRMDRNMELLLSERFVEKKQKQTLKECYSISTIQQPFTLMKVQTHDRTISDTRLMNLNNTLITQKSPSLNANDESTEITYLNDSRQSSLPLIKYCIKELVVLFEAKSNRKETINVKQFCYRHAVNVLGVCLFGKPVNELTNSTCQFYYICDDLIDVFVNRQKSKPRQYLAHILQNIGMQNQNQKVQRVVQYFTTTLQESIAGQRPYHENCLLNTLLRQFSDASNEHTGNQNELVDSISAFLIAFSINVLEMMGGSMTLMLYDLAKNTELQEKLRNSHKVQFDLDGIPSPDWQKIMQPTLVDSIINETLQNRPVDPIIQLTSKQTYRIPDTKIRLNPESVVFVPLDVLRSADSSKSPETCIEHSNSFIVDLETQSFNLFVGEFVKICLKASLTSLLQQYEFNVNDECIDQDEGVVSCRYTTLPNEICLTLSRVEKRGKVVIFEESLKAFHALQNAPFLWHGVLRKCFSTVLSH